MVGAAAGHVLAPAVRDSADLGYCFPYSLSISSSWATSSGIVTELPIVDS